jgi:hypothetical protein
MSDVLGLQPGEKHAGLPLPARAVGLILFLPGYRLRPVGLARHKALECMLSILFLQLKKRIPAPAVAFAAYPAI